MNRLQRLLVLVFAPVWVPLFLGINMLYFLFACLLTPFYWVWTGKDVFDTMFPSRCL